VRLWALNRIRDRDGNFIEFTYTEDNANGTYRPNEIRWTGNTGQGLTPAYKAVFVYEARSTADPLVRYENGFKSKETNRLLRLDVFYNTTNIVRRYTPSYFAAASTPRTRIDNMNECGKGDLLCSLALRFNWQTGTNTLGNEAASTASLTAGTVAHSVDANGDGRTDLVYPSGSNWWAMFGLVGGGYGSPSNTGIAATNVATSHSIDYNGDGIRDVLFSDGTNWRVLQGSGTGTFTQVLTSRAATGASNGQIKVADINGDGLEDLVYVSGTTLRARLNSTSGLAATDVLVYTLPAGNSFDSNPFGVPGVEEYRSVGAGLDVDYNGDGRTDLLAKTIPTGGGATTWRTLVAGGTQAAPTYTADSTITSAAGERPLILDLNGDGYSDIIGRNGGNWIITFAKGGASSVFDATTVSPSITTDLNNAIAMDYDTDGTQDVLLNIGGTWNVAYSTRESVATPATTGYQARVDVRAVDVDGDGLSDLAFNNAGTWTSRTHSGEVPDLASEGYDAFGIYFATFYKGLHEVDTYTRDANPTFPAKRFTAPLQVVHFYVYADGTGFNSYVSQWYWNANWHAQGRGFLGFTKAKDWHNNTDVGNWVEYGQTFPYIGLPTSVSQRRGDGTTKISESVLTLTNLAFGAGFETRNFPYASNVTAKRWESDGAYHNQQITQAVTAVTMDTFGTPYDVTTTTTEQASANGAQTGVSYVSRTVTPIGNLVNDTTNWCLGQRTQIQSIRSHSAYGGGSLTRTTNQTWDAPKCRVTQTVAEPGSSTRQVTTTLGYDGFGNVNSRAVVGKNPNGTNMATRTTTISWGTTGQFPMTVTNPLSQASTFGYDFADGTRTSVTDPNGIQSTMVYDARGRLIRTNNPDGTASTTEFAECGLPPLPSCESGTGPNEFIVISKTLDTSGNRLTEQWTYVDELVRPLVVSRQTMSSGWNRVNYEYDKEKNLKRQTAPFWWGGGTQYWTNFSYDRLNRQTQTNRPISDSDPTLQYTYTYYEGLTTRVVDANGKEKKSIRNVAGGQAQSRDHDGYGQNFDYDAFGATIRVVDTDGVTLQSNTIDNVGFKTASTEVNRGAWSFVYNSLGEMTQQTDANTTVTTFQYDLLGRMTQRVEPIPNQSPHTITSAWVYGVAADNSAGNKYIGRLKSQSVTSTNQSLTSDYNETFTYDQYARPIQAKYRDVQSNADYYVDREYQSWTGYLNSLTYPDSNGQRLRLQYEYQNGELKRVKDYNQTWLTFWEAVANNARGQNIEEQNGNGIKTVMGFDEVTARMDYIQSGLWGGTGTQNLAYQWDKVGNLTQRQDNNQGLSENFYYDNLYRLDYSQLNGTTNLDMQYKANGNIDFKSNAGWYWYDPVKVHAVLGHTGGGGYGYDANGNMTSSSDSGTITFYGNNLPKFAYKDANNSSHFHYAPDRSRWRHSYKANGTDFNTIYVESLFEKVTDSGSGKITFKNYVRAAGMLVAMKARDSWGGDNTTYLHGDHLGSVSNYTDGGGNSLVAASYDAFGNRRGSNWAGNPTSGELTTMNNLTRRGFTEHEMLDSSALVHMNGRAYNPIVGRFVGADPITDALLGTQGWNRYSYVGNRSVSLFDPTGFCGAASREEPWITGCPVMMLTVAVFPGFSGSRTPGGGVDGTITLPNIPDFRATFTIQVVSINRPGAYFGEWYVLTAIAPYRMKNLGSTGEGATQSFAAWTAVLGEDGLTDAFDSVAIQNPSGKVITNVSADLLQVIGDATPDEPTEPTPGPPPPPEPFIEPIPLPDIPEPPPFSLWSDWW
jgi:RHS repeat-associated protein